MISQSLQPGTNNFNVARPFNKLNAHSREQNTGKAAEDQKFDIQRNGIRSMTSHTKHVLEECKENFVKTAVNDCTDGRSMKPIKATRQCDDKDQIRSDQDKLARTNNTARQSLVPDYGKNERIEFELNDISRRLFDSSSEMNRFGSCTDHNLKSSTSLLFNRPYKLDDDGIETESIGASDCTDCSESCEDMKQVRPFSCFEERRGEMEEGGEGNRGGGGSGVRESGIVRRCRGSEEGRGEGEVVGAEDCKSGGVLRDTSNHFPAYFSGYCRAVDNFTTEPAGRETDERIIIARAKQTLCNGCGCEQHSCGCDYANETNMLNHYPSRPNCAQSQKPLQQWQQQQLLHRQKLHREQLQSRQLKHEQQQNQELFPGCAGILYPERHACEPECVRDFFVRKGCNGRNILSPSLPSGAISANASGQQFSGKFGLAEKFSAVAEEPNFPISGKSTEAEITYYLDDIDRNHYASRTAEIRTFLDDEQYSLDANFQPIGASTGCNLQRLIDGYNSSYKKHEHPQDGVVSSASGCRNTAPDCGSVKQRYSIAPITAVRAHQPKLMTHQVYSTQVIRPSIHKASIINPSTARATDPAPSDRDRQRTNGEDLRTRLELALANHAQITPSYFAQKTNVVTSSDRDLTSTLLEPRRLDFELSAFSSSEQSQNWTPNILNGFDGELNHPNISNQSQTVRNMYAPAENRPASCNTPQLHASGFYGGNGNCEKDGKFSDRNGSHKNGINSENANCFMSPKPLRRAVATQNDARVKYYPALAFKFYMEQHMENILKYYEERRERLNRLEEDMAKLGLADDERVQLRKFLYSKESQHLRLRRTKMTKEMFERIAVLGSGAFGDVYLVRKKDTRVLYAMKTLQKSDVLRKKQVAHVKAERDILAEADNEWVVKLYYSFQDSTHLYFIMDYIPGGDLMGLLMKLEIFDHSLALFYIAELVLAIESVHRLGFIHRDIKPDNILIDLSGHIILTDFGLCTGFHWTHDSSYYKQGHYGEDVERQSEVVRRSANRSNHRRLVAKSLVGTPNYIAPEVLLENGYTSCCDWWSVGVILYEMRVGQAPFIAETALETQLKVINWRATLNFPASANLSRETTDLILRLCCDDSDRLGRHGSEEVKSHPFFSGVDFNTLRQQPAPHIPRVTHPTDTSNFDAVDPHKLKQDTSTNDAGPASDSLFQDAFLDFTFRRFFDNESQTNSHIDADNIYDSDSSDASFHI